MQGLVEVASSHKSGSGLELRSAVIMGQFDDSDMGTSIFSEAESTTFSEVSILYLVVVHM